MRKLHLVGLTTDHKGLIFTARRGSESGGYVVSLDAEILRAIARAQGRPNGTDLVRPGGEYTPGPGAQTRRRGLLTPREIQARLRAGRSADDVAEEADVEVEWVERFAVPILAEQAQVVELAQTLVYDKPKVGSSSLPLDEAVNWHLLDRGARVTDDVFDTSWSAYQLHDQVWMIKFSYRSRGRPQEARWELDVGSGELVARNKVAGELGYVEAGARPRPRPIPPEPDEAAEGAAAAAAATRASRAAARAADKAAAADAAAALDEDGDDDDEDDGDDDDGDDDDGVVLVDDLDEFDDGDVDVDVADVDADAAMPPRAPRPPTVRRSTPRRSAGPTPRPPPPGRRPRPRHPSSRRPPAGRRPPRRLPPAGPRPPRPPPSRPQPPPRPQPPSRPRPPPRPRPRPRPALRRRLRPAGRSLPARWRPSPPTPPARWHRRMRLAPPMGRAMRRAMRPPRSPAEVAAGQPEAGSESAKSRKSIAKADPAPPPVRGLLVSTGRGARPVVPTRGLLVSSPRMRAARAEAEAPPAAPAPASAAPAPGGSSDAGGSDDVSADPAPEAVGKGAPTGPAAPPAPPATDPRQARAAAPEPPSTPGGAGVRKAVAQVTSVRVAASRALVARAMLPKPAPPVVSRPTLGGRVNQPPASDNAPLPLRPRSRDSATPVQPPPSRPGPSQEPTRPAAPSGSPSDFWVIVGPGRPPAAAAAAGGPGAGVGTVALPPLVPDGGVRLRRFRPTGRCPPVAVHAPARAHLAPRTPVRVPASRS